jgi:hypothetical protein
LHLPPTDIYEHGAYGSKDVAAMRRTRWVMTALMSADELCEVAGFSCAPK